MQHAEQLRLLDGLLAHLDAGTNVDAGGMMRNPVDAYTDPEILATEWDLFFRDHPQLIGMTGDLPEPGSFLTINDFGVPILATRTAEGEFKAFLNVCRHRGAIVEGREKGNAKKFGCPFHAWTYSNEGALIGLPRDDHFGEIDRDCHSLVALPAVEHAGLLWVHPKPDGEIDLDTILGGMGEELEHWDFGSYIRTGGATYDTALNWKLANDTFGETYHFPTLHANTLAEFFHGNCQMYDTFGRNHRMILCRKAIEEMREWPRDKWDVTIGGLPVYYLFPNVQLIPGYGNVILIRIYPDPKDPGRSVSQISFFFTEETMATAPERVQHQAIGFSEIIRDEDYMVAASTQIGAASGAQTHVLFGRNEPALHHYHNTYREAMGQERLPVE